MPGAIGNPMGGAQGGAVGDAGAGAQDDGTKAKAFEKALSQFAMQIVESDMDEMNQVMRDTEEDFE